jgi:uncharacterized protein YdaU (DUF1376 family)
MAEFPTMPLHTDAIVADTQHLDNAEFGAYMRLLVFAWRTPDCSLPDDDRRLAIMLGLTPSKWRKIKPVIMSFWDLTDGKWTQKKQQKVREKVSKNVQQKVSAGKASAKAKALKTNDPASTDVPTDEATERQQPKPKPKPKEETSKDVPSKPLIPPKGGLGFGCETLEDEFEGVWRHYPRKVGKGAALKKWKVARKSVEFEKITGPLGVFIRAQHQNNVETSKIPHLATWLYQTRWEDDQTHAINAPLTSDGQLDRLNQTTSDGQLDNLFPERRMIGGK